MATDGPTPAPCDQEIFEKGESVAALNGRSNAVERWVQKIARQANARVDWHYSGGIANVLHLGDVESRIRVMKAISELESELEGKILRLYDEGATGLYRAGVTDAPSNTITVFNTGAASPTFIVDPTSD